MSVDSLQPGTASRSQEGIRVDNMDAAHNLGAAISRRSGSAQQAEGSPLPASTQANGTATTGDAAANALAVASQPAREPRGSIMSRRNIEPCPSAGGAPVVALLFAMIAINEASRSTVDSLSVPTASSPPFAGRAHLPCKSHPAPTPPAALAFGLSARHRFITRIAPFTDAPNMAQGQVVWPFVGVACMIVVLALFRNLDKIANYKYTSCSWASSAALAPMVPGLARRSTGCIWLHIGGFSLPTR